MYLSFSTFYYPYYHDHQPQLSVLGCLEQYNLNETSNCVVFTFFQILRFEIKGAAYTRKFTLNHKRFGYIAPLIAFNIKSFDYNFVPSVII